MTFLGASVPSAPPPDHRLSFADGLAKPGEDPGAGPGAAGQVHGGFGVRHGRGGPQAGSGWQGPPAAVGRLQPLRARTLTTLSAVVDNRIPCLLSSSAAWREPQYFVRLSGNIA